MDWKLVASVFGIIFIAELPDKTAVATLVLASRYSAWAVMLGSACALTAQSVIAIAAGRALAMLPARPVHVATGIVFLVSAIFMWRRGHEESEEEKKHHAKKTFLRAFLSTFVVVFLAEWGDLTQIATAALAAHYGKPLTIFVGATSALWAVAAIAVFVGHHVARYVKPETTKRAAAIVFAMVGGLMLANVAINL